MLVHAGFVGTAAVFHKGVGSHGQDGDTARVGAVQLADGPGGLVAVHHRHHHVHDDGIKGAGGAGGKLVQRVLPVDGLCHRDTGVLQHKHGDLYVQFVVLGQQYVHALRRGGRQGGGFLYPRGSAGVDGKGNRDAVGRALP